MRRADDDDRYGGRDPVTADVVHAVLVRQGYVCVARLLDRDADDCAGRMTMDHVKDQPEVGAPIVKRGPARRRRYRAPSDPAHLVAVCEHHHLYGWATSHRVLLRDYLRGG